MHRRTMRIIAGVPLLFSLVGFGCGTVERRIIITSEPQGARVFLNDTDVGVTPTEVDFTWFGVYDIRLNLPGHEPIVTKREAKAPLHEQPIIDLVAIAMPTHKSTIIEWHFTLEPASTDVDALLDRARDLRERTKNEMPASEDASAPSPSESRIVKQPERNAADAPR